MITALKRRSISARKHNSLKEVRRILNPADEELALLLNSGIRTVYRWLEEGPPEQYYPLIRLQELLDLARKSMKLGAVAEWFHEPNRALGGFVPIRLILDSHGYEVVRDELGRAAYGLPV